MASTPSVAIVGGGVLGLSTALELQKLGVHNVTVLERKYPGEGSSGLSVGMVESQYLDRAAVEARVFGLNFYRSLSAEHGLDYTRSGYLRLGSSTEDLSAFENSVAVQREFDVNDSCVLTTDEIARRWPQIIVSGRAGGLFGPSDGYIDGYQYCTLAAKLVTEGGGTVVPNAAVAGATRTSSGWRLNTASREFDADIVINAAGPWAGQFGDILGVSTPLRPQLHGAITVDLKNPMDPMLPFVMDYVPNSGTDGVYFRSERNDQLIAGLHTDEIVHEPVSPDFRLGRVSNDEIERIIGLMSERLNIVDDLAVSGSWQGIYPMSPDHRPIVGSHPADDSVICALGAGGSGIQLAPAIGRVAAEAAVGAKQTFGWSADWSPSRFATQTI